MAFSSPSRRTACGLSAALAAVLVCGLLPPPAGGSVIEAVDLGGLETRTAALILSGQQAGDLAISVLAIPLPPGPGVRPPEVRPPGGGGVPVALVVDIEGGPLLAGRPEDGEEAAALITEVYVYALDAENRLRATLTQAFRLDLGRYRAALAGGGVKFLGGLDLEPGDYSLRVLVLHRRSGRLTLRIVPLSVPPPEGPALAPPIVPEPAGRWILVRQAGLEAPGSLPWPMQAAGGAWVPATRPRVAAGASKELYLLGRGLGRGIRAHLVTGGGEEIAELGLGDLRPVAGAPAGLEMLAAELRTPNVPAGDYLLRISAPRETGMAAATLPLAVPPSESELTLQTELEGDAGVAPTGVPGPSEAAEPARGDGRQAVGRARGAYLEALAQLRSGDLAAARLALVELESAAVSTEIASRAPALEQQLLQSQALAALELTGRQAESFVPLIWLHEQLFEQYHRHRRYLLATHSRRALLALSQSYLNASGRTPEARRLAAAAMVSLGGYFQQIGDKVGAAKAYHQALEHDPAQEAALIGLATIREKWGEYKEAADLLERFLKWRPGDTEAHLRLAVNLRRLEKYRRALSHLESCVDDRSRSDWVTAVAYQELAALHAAEGRFPEALATLDEAVERLPGQQRLHLQLAALLDRMDRPAEARSVLAGLDAEAGRDQDSPRLRYSQRPTADLARTRQLLAEEARRRLPPGPAAATAAAAGRPAAKPPAGDVADRGPGGNGR